jgi:hypothetical protein
MMIWLLACAEDAPKSDGAYAEEYAGSAGALLTFAPLGEPDGAARTLTIGEDAWEMTPDDRWTRSAADALVVDDVTLLPARLSEGASDGAATIETMGEWTVWYGTFPKTVEVTVAEGDFAGTAVFAEGVGPIQLTLRGEALETTTYELPSYE